MVVAKVQQGWERLGQVRDWWWTIFDVGSWVIPLFQAADVMLKELLDS